MNPIHIALHALVLVLALAGVSRCLQALERAVQTQTLAIQTQTLMQICMAGLQLTHKLPPPCLETRKP